MTTINNLYGLRSPANCSFKSLHDSQLFGLELEIENITVDADTLVRQLQMTWTTDGSLRNNGLEFLTNPMNIDSIEETLSEFFKRGKFTQESYSERTSVHVHANCQELTREQLHGVLLLYQLYERLLYAWVGDERDKNIFCVPWNQTNLPNLVLRNKALDKLRNWQKYTGLNLLPLMKLGTIEFRHMAGTNNLKKIINWCKLINKLLVYGKTNPIEKLKESIVTLNTTSHYAGFSVDVFGDMVDHLVSLPNYIEMLEEGVLDTKYGILIPKNEKMINETAGFIDEVQEIRQREALAEVQRLVAAALQEPERRRPEQAVVPPQINTVQVIDNVGGNRNEAVGVVVNRNRARRT